MIFFWDQTVKRLGATDTFLQIEKPKQGPDLNSVENSSDINNRSSGRKLPNNVKNICCDIVCDYSECIKSSRFHKIMCELLFFLFFWPGSVQCTIKHFLFWFYVPYNSNALLFVH